MIETLLFLASSVPADPSPTGSSTLDTITPFLNLGIVGLMIIMFISRKGIVPEWVLKEAEARHEREMAKKDEDIAELKRLVADSTRLYNDQVVPAFTRSIDVNREYVELLREERERPRRRTRATGGGE